MEQGVWYVFLRLPATSMDAYACVCARVGRVAYVLDTRIIIITTIIITI
jgi:hypothetical protein